MELFWRLMRDKSGRRGFLHVANGLNNTHLVELETDLQRLEIPTLIIRGDADLYLSENISLKLHRDIPGSRLVHIEDGGHFIQEDAPERIAGCLREFWQDAASGAHGRRRS